jgi:hypothetical protein
MIVQEWSIHDIDPKIRDSVLPPNLLSTQPKGQYCLQFHGRYWPGGFVCTRLTKHTGRHAAGYNGRIVAVWP